MEARQRNDQYHLRLPDGLSEDIKRAAATSDRSMNSEIILRLKASFEPANALDAEITRLLNGYIDAKVEERLREIARQIGGA